MHLSDHDLLAEARRKKELLEKEAAVERLLDQARSTVRPCWRMRTAVMLLALADRLSPETTSAKSDGLSCR